jgi:hypothetical protein
MGKRHTEAEEREAGQDPRIDDLDGQQRAGAPAAATGGISSQAIQQLEELGKLHEQGVLTDDELTQQKQKLLAGLNAQRPSAACFRKRRECVGAADAAARQNCRV